MRAIILLLFALSWATPVVYVFGVAGSGKAAFIRSLCNVTSTSPTGRYDCPPIKATVVNTPGFGTPKLPMVYSVPEDMSLALVIGPPKLLEVHRVFIRRFWQMTKQRPVHLLMAALPQSNIEIRKAISKYL